MGRTKKNCKKQPTWLASVHCAFTPTNSLAQPLRHRDRQDPNTGPSGIKRFKCVLWLSSSAIVDDFYTDAAKMKKLNIEKKTQHVQNKQVIMNKPPAPAATPHEISHAPALMAVMLGAFVYVTDRSWKRAVGATCSVYFIFAAQTW